MSRPEKLNSRDWSAHPPYLHEPYRSTLLRAPKKPLVPLEQSLSELTAPVFGHEAIGELDNDLTKVRWDDLPLLPGVERYASAGHIPGGGRRNREYYQRWIRIERDLIDWKEQLLFDPQTSGGLLLAAAADRAELLGQALRQAGEPVWNIGEAIEGEAGFVELV